MHDVLWGARLGHRGTGALARARAGARSPRIEVSLLGPVHVELDGRAVRLDAAKQRAVLVVLALHAGRAVCVDRVIDDVWGDCPPASARKMVQLYVSQLRRLLGPGASTVMTEGRGYRLDVAYEAVDAVRFTELVLGALGGRADAARNAGESLRMWRGDPLQDLVDHPFASRERDRLTELWLRAHEIVYDDALRRGEHPVVLATVDALIAAHPTRERLHAQRMLALYRDDRRANALAAFLTARAALVERCGIEPGRELQRLHEALLRDDASLDGPVRPAPLSAA